MCVWVGEKGRSSIACIYGGGRVKGAVKYRLNLLFLHILSIAVAVCPCGLSIATLALKRLKLPSIMGRGRKAARTESSVPVPQPMMMPYGFGMQPQACVPQTHSEQNNDSHNDSNIYNFCFSCDRLYL